MARMALGDEKGPRRQKPVGNSAHTPGAMFARNPAVPWGPGPRVALTKPLGGAPKGTKKGKGPPFKRGGGGGGADFGLSVI